MPALYELTGIYGRLLRNEEEETGVDLSAILGELTDQIEVKTEGICKVLRSLEEEQRAYENEADRLRVRASNIQGKIYGLKNYLQQNLEAAGIDKVKTPLFSVALQNSPFACEITDFDALPAEWKHQVFEWKTDRKLLIEHYKATGEIVPGTRITQSKHIRIR